VGAQVAVGRNVIHGGSLRKGGETFPRCLLAGLFGDFRSGVKRTLKRDLRGKEKDGIRKAVMLIGWPKWRG